MMSLDEIYNLLTDIDGFKDKVAYRSFPVGNAPDLPFICYLETDTNNFFADNNVRQVIRGIDIELYTDTKEPTTEKKLEDALEKANLPWNKYEEYIDSERCYQITYSLEV